MNKELAEFCGICWHEEASNISQPFCGKCNADWVDFCMTLNYGRPDFTTPNGFALLHGAMGKKKLWWKFYRYLTEGKLMEAVNIMAEGICFQEETDLSKKAKLIYEFVQEGV